MKKILVYMAISGLFLATVNGFAQTTVTGHVFAEVVESVSASSFSQSSLMIQRNQTEKVDIGQINVKSAGSASCSLILGKVLLKGYDNQIQSLETSAGNSLSMQSNAINGSQLINLQCQPEESLLDQNTSSYQGDINIVLAYN